MNAAAPTSRSADETALADAEAVGRPFRAFLPRLVAFAAVVVVVVVVDPDPGLSLLLLAVVGVVTIVSESRFSFERRLERAHLPSREAWVPLVLLATMFQLGLVDGDNVRAVAADDGPVIAFILAFALVAEGLTRSGFIHYLAYRLSERGGGDTTRLTLYLFLLSSVLTYFTSNDIVILTMTPIVVSVAYQAQITNAKLLLLSQFVAANTVSMGILIGSPTNLILGRGLGIGFVHYLLLMLVPSAMALMATFVLVTWANRLVGWLTARATTRGQAEAGKRSAPPLVGSWHFAPHYTPPRFSEYRSVTRRMTYWVTVFAASVLLLAVTTASSRGLLVVAIVIATVGIGSLLWDERRRPDQAGAPARRSRRQSLVRTAGVLPVGIVFFGLTYFVIADAMADSPFVRDEVDEFVTDHASSHTPIPSWGAIFASGALVNTMNDLPASALAGRVLPRIDYETPFDEAVVVQGTLVGLNIATYVTPVGALAGIIWFTILRNERANRTAAMHRETHARPGRVSRRPIDVTMPDRRDLVVYGTAMFLAVGAVLGATNFGFVALADALVGPPSGGTDFGEAPGHLLWTLPCLALAVGVVVAFRIVLRQAQVALAHLGDLLVVLTKVRLWASRHRVAFAAVVAGLLFAGSGALLYWVELFHADQYDVPTQFDGPGEFVTWLVVFVSSGFERGRFPYSVAGNLLAAALAIGSIGALLLLVRLSVGSSDLGLRRKIATGEVRQARVVVINAALENMSLVDTFLARSRRFVTVVTRDRRLTTALELRDNGRLGVVPYDEDAAALVASLRLADANEVVLLSRSVTDDFDNLAILTALDVTWSRAPDDAAGQQAGSLPAVVLQAHSQEAPTLVERRVSSELWGVVACPSFEETVRRLLVAEVAGPPSAVGRFYDEGMAEGFQPDADGAYLDVVGRRFSLGVDPAPADLGARLLFPAVGVQVELGGRPDWRTEAAVRADELHRTVTGTVVVASSDAVAGGEGRDEASGTSAGADDTDAAGDAGAGLGPRPRVAVVGTGGITQRCARDLAAAGIDDITLFVPADEDLSPDVGDERITVVRCAHAAETADHLVHLDDGGDNAILVVEGPGGGAIDIDKLLERLSIWRLREADAHRVVSPLYVCCRGPERAQRLHNFVVDEVIDATWVESSYATVFTTLYYDTIDQDPVAAQWPASRRVSVAHRAAARLCHFDVTGPPAGEGGRPRRTVRAGAPLARSGGAVTVPVIGVARIAIEQARDVDGDGEADRVVAVTVDVVTEERPEDRSLRLGLPYL